jgi:hypothetical protein
MSFKFIWPLENCETEITTVEPVYNEIGLYDTSPI